jgi:hypothetical protein
MIKQNDAATMHHHVTCSTTRPVTIQGTYIRCKHTSRAVFKPPIHTTILTEFRGIQAQPRCEQVGVRHFEGTNVVFIRFK